MDNQWHKKESPVQGITGLWGGIASNLTGGGALLVGQDNYFSVGSHTWTAPNGVESVSVLAIGGGGEAKNSGYYGGGGGGGGLGWKNNHAVSAGTGYNVTVGSSDGDSYFINSTTAFGEGGQSAETNQQSTMNPGGNHAGGGGGNGGYGAVRIIYPGAERLYPTTRTADE